MEQKFSKSAKPDEVDTLLQMLPQFLERLVPEFEILLGKKLKTNATHINIKSLERKLQKLLIVVSQLEKASDEILTPESARKRLELLNLMLQLSVPRIPKNKEPIQYMIEVVNRQSQIPSDLVLPKGLDYNTKHLNLQAFVSELVLSTNKSRLDTFLQSSLTERQLVSQFQRIFGKISLPKELQSPPVKISVRSIERLKLGLRDVTADWEALINLLYGLVVLKQGRVPTWSGVRSVSLWDKVDCVRHEPRLITLAKQEWVTVRNSLDHSLAFFDPAKESIVFRERTRVVSWDVGQTYLEAIDIYLAKSAILRTWNFMQTANMQVFKEQLARLKALAQQ